MDPTGLIQVQNEVFDYFLKFESLVFLEIAYNYSLQQYLIFGRGKTHEKEFCAPNLDQTSGNRPEIKFFAIFLSLVQCFSLKLRTMIACNIV